MTTPTSVFAGPAAVSSNTFYLPLIKRAPITLILTVKKIGSGSGTVTSSPAGIACGSTCSAAFNFGTDVTLTATAGSGSIFNGWSGDCSGSGNCVVPMDAARSVTAEFTGNTYQLRIGLSGNGTGIVTSDPAGIDCGSTCFAYFAYNTRVTLTATAIAPAIFSGWNGDVCSGTGTCQVTMDANQQVSAAFTLPCSEIINCDFETIPNVAWTEYSYNKNPIIYDCTNPANCNYISPRSGIHMVWLGGDIDETAYIEQKQILISSVTPYLVYWQWIESEDYCGFNYDYAEVFINGAQVDKYDLCYGTSTLEWVSHSIDLTAYMGQQVTLRIQVRTDDSNMSNLYIDDVSMQPIP